MCLRILILRRHKIQFMIEVLHVPNFEAMFCASKLYTAFQKLSQGKASG